MEYVARAIDKISISIMAGGSVDLSREQRNREGENGGERREKRRGEDDFDASPSRQPYSVITRLAERRGGSNGVLRPPFPSFSLSSVPSPSFVRSIRFALVARIFSRVLSPFPTLRSIPLSPVG